MRMTGATNARKYCKARAVVNRHFCRSAGDEVPGPEQIAQPPSRWKAPIMWSAMMDYYRFIDTENAMVGSSTCTAAAPQASTGKRYGRTRPAGQLRNRVS